MNKLLKHKKTLIQNLYKQFLCIPRTYHRRMNIIIKCKAAPTPRKRIKWETVDIWRPLCCIVTEVWAPSFPLGQCAAIWMIYVAASSSVSIFWKFDWVLFTQLAEMFLIDLSNVFSYINETYRMSFAWKFKVVCTA